MSPGRTTSPPERRSRSPAWLPSTTSGSTSSSMASCWTSRIRRSSRRMARVPSADVAPDLLVRRLLADQFPQWADLPLKRVASSGTVNALYRLGDHLVVRLPLRPSGGADIALERTWLPRLAPLLPVPVPVPVGLGKPAGEMHSGWAVYHWLPGEHPPEGSAGADLVSDLAGFVRAISRVSLPGAPPAYRGGSLREQDAGTREAIAELGDRVDVRRVTAAWEDALDTP